ncbi:antitoxin [Pseudomonas caspiana]|uniref:AbrB/MazE/SpoVT family DNA-binding domain-containing protein n=1 Tax=Pseudomonas caspiana TaxID=1451454 RepID=UPI0032EEAE01
MLAMPPAFLDHLKADANDSLAIDEGSLVVNPKLKPRYTLAQLLAVPDFAQSQSDEHREWIDGPAVGSELI